MTESLLNGRYRLDSEIAQGGMGVIYRAYDVLLDRPVAVKVLSGAASAGLGDETRDRLLNEARSAARLNHPNIVTVYDAGETEGLPYIVMELVEGQSLHNHPLQTIPDIISVARQICAALEHAHAHGIVHRDLKPENVIVTPDGGAKLMDFGLARSSSLRLGGDETITGTLYYLAPEQALGRDVDGRTDLYALGVMLYELVTGRLPFTGDDPLAIISQHLRAQPSPPGTINPELPEAMEAAILKLMAKDPDDRFATAREVAQALLQIEPGNQPKKTERIPNNLPVQLSSFIGREQALEEVRRLLSVSRLITLTGPGGSGKTRLALQVATNLLETFPDGAWLVELAPLSDPALVPQAVASVLEVRETPGRNVLESLSDHLRSRQLLLVLDNCEHLVEACARLVEILLRTCPSLRILTTSREPIGITGEITWSVPPLSTPNPDLLGEIIDFKSLFGKANQGRQILVSTLKKYESVCLFVDRAVAVQPTFKLTETNAMAVAQICKRLEGIPLAIELAAARLRALSIDQIAARLDDRLALLTVGSRTALPRHQTLRATIDWSYELLSDTERILLNRLSVFVDGWVLEAAEAICGCQGIQTYQVLDLLTRLVDKSLVVMDDQAPEPRYSLLDTIRQYAQQKLESSGEVDLVYRRHLNYYLGLAETAEPLLRSAEQVAWLDRLEAEYDNLWAALDWSLSNGEALCGLRLAGSLSRFWYLRGHWRDGRKWLARTLAGIEEKASTDRQVMQAKAKALQGQGWLADESGAEAGPYSQSLEISRQLNDKWGAAFSLRGLGVLAGQQDDRKLAIERLEESLALFKELNEPWGMGLALFNLGWVYFWENEPDRSESLWEQSLSHFRQPGDRWGSAVCLGALAYLARLRGDYGQATALSNESLALFRELGDKAGIADSLSRLGSVAFRRDNLRQATELYEESLALLRELGYHSGIAYAYCILGLIACYQGDFKRAVTWIEEALSIWRDLGHRQGQAWGYDALALAAYYWNESDRATLLWEESLEICRAEDDRNGMAFALNGTGLIALQRGDYDQAKDKMEQSLAIFKEKGDKRNIAIALHSLGKLAHAQGNSADAARMHKESLSMRADLGARRGIAESLEQLARLAEFHGQVERAARLLAAAQELRQAAGAPLPPVESGEYEWTLAALRARIPADTFSEIWSDGRKMAGGPVEALINFALAA